MPTDPLDRLKSALCCYRIDRELGRGGMATVYLAHDLKHDRAVALKAILPDVSSSLGPERFLREIRTAARLSHPHIVGLFDSGEVDGLFYYVMPYIRGESLRQRLQRTGRLGFDEAAAIARDVAAALDYAHATGLLHRDIKPENILLHEGEAMVTDFGIALALNPAGTVRMTEAGRSLGTPEYMSPEQIAGDREMDGRSDQYAVACVVYEMLAGEPPYQAPSPAGIILKQATAPVPSLRRLRPDTPLHIEQAVTRALAKAPEERFPFVIAFAEGIQPQDCSIVTPLRIHQPVNGDPPNHVPSSFFRLPT